MNETNQIVLQQAGNLLPPKLQAHWPAICVILMWFMRELHNFMPGIWAGMCAAWPCITSHGGLLGLWKALLKGAPQPQPPQSPIAKP